MFLNPITDARAAVNGGAWSVHSDEPRPKEQAKTGDDLLKVEIGRSIPQFHSLKFVTTNAPYRRTTPETVCRFAAAVLYHSLLPRVLR